MNTRMNLVFMPTIFSNFRRLYREEVVEEELVRRMASKWEKVMDKAALKAWGRKLIICGRSVNWWDEELRQLVKDGRTCFAQGLDNDSNWNDYLKIHKELKQKIREKKKIFREELMDNVNSNNSKNIKAFWKFVKGSIKSSAKNKIETLTDDSGKSVSSQAGKVKILKSHYRKLGTELDVNPLMIHGRRKYLIQLKISKQCLFGIHIPMECWINR